MLRRLLIIVLIFLIAVVIAVDRVGALVAGHVLASKLETDEHLPNRPTVSISGVPFLTQAFSGKYDKITVTAHEVPVQHVPVTTLTVHLHGVHVPLSKIVHDSVHTVPVDRVDGSAFVSFDDANSYLAQHSSVGSLVRLVGVSSRSVLFTDQLRLGGRSVTLKGVGSLTVNRNVIGVTVSNLSGAASRLISRVIGGLRVTLPLQGLPFRLVLQSVTVTASGVTATGGASNVVLGS